MYPDRGQGPILFGATPTLATTATGDPPWAVSREEFNQRIELIVSTWGEPWALERFAPSRMDDPGFRDWWSRVFRAASSPASIRAVLENARDADIRPLLPQVPTRTLVLHRVGDRIVHLDASRFFANQLPNATLLELPGNDHVFFIDGDPVIQAVGDFLRAPAATPVIETRIAIMVYVAEPVLRVSPDKRAAAEGPEGGLIQAAGTGWRVTIPGPDRAIQAARRLRDLGQARPAPIVIHVGACRLSAGRPADAAIETAAELATLAEPGHILVSNTLRDILAGAGIRLETLSSENSHGWTLVD